MSDQNLYEILGVRRDASWAEIRAAYLKLAKEWHPDRNPNQTAEAERRFKEIAHAYEVLSDRNKRAAYDAAGTGGEQSSSFEDTMDDSAAFDLFISVLLELAFELAEAGADQIAIYQSLVDMGCPPSAAKTIANKAHSLGGRDRGSRDGAPIPQPEHRAGKGNGGSSGGNKASNPATAGRNDSDARFIAGPWSRWFARSLDILVGTAVASPLIGWLFQWAWTIEQVPLRLAAYVFLITPIPLIVDAVIVGLFGNSLGKALLNIRVLYKVSVDRTEVLSPIGFEDAVLRNFNIWVKGYWLSVPILVIIPQFLAYLRVSEGKPAAWDMRPQAFLVKEKISELVSESSKQQFFFVLREKAQWELVSVFVICAVALPLVAKVGGETFTGSTFYQSPLRNVEVPQDAAAAPDVTVPFDAREFPQYAEQSEPKEEIDNEALAVGSTPTVGQFRDEIDNAVQEFSRILAKSGMSGAERYSRKCQAAARESQDILDTDFCVAFDMSAIIMDYSYSQASGASQSQYFQARAGSLDLDYSRFPQAVPNRAKIIWSQVSDTLDGRIQETLAE